MKKFLLSAFALAVAISASAFNLAPAKNHAPINAQKCSMALNQQISNQFKGIKTMPTVPVRASEEDLVTVPDGVTIETDWTINGVWIYPISQSETATEAIETATEVAIDGNDVYIKGLAVYFPDAWVKGTINGTTATFPITYVGSDNYGDEYLAGYSNSAISSFTFTYDAENNSFTLNGLLIENGSDTEVYPFAYYTSLTIAQGEIVKPDLVTPPDGLETEDFTFFAYAAEDVDNEGNITWEEDETQLDIKIGEANDVVYIQGLCKYLPEAWVIASFNEDGELVIPTGQYLGAVNNVYDMYLLGYGDTGLEDIVFTYSEEYGCYIIDHLVILSSKANAISWYEIYGYGAIGQFAENVYILGQVNGNDWAANVGYAMTTEDGVTYTADITCAPVNENDTDGYSFFSFTTQLAENADDWNGIAAYRFGAVSNGDFLVTNELLGQELSLTNENGQAFQIPDGVYNLVLNLDNMKLVITKKATPAVTGDVTGDGIADIDDVNAIINIILKVKTVDDYPGIADLNEDGQVDVDDMNIVINIILTQNN